MDDYSYKEIEQKLHDEYFKVIKPKLRYFEQQRLAEQKKCKDKSWALFTICAILALCALRFHYILSAQICFFGFFICEGIKWFSKIKIEKEVKQNFMQLICKCFGNLEWRQSIYLTPYEFYAVGLIDDSSPCFDDIFSGNYKGINFEIIETNIPYSSDNGKSSETSKNSEGIIIKIQTKKNCNCHTILRPDSLVKHSIEHLRRTELEDVIFEKKYDVYTDDEIKARVILNASFMEKLSNISNIFKAKSTSCVFIEDKIYIRLCTNKNMFEIFSFEDTDSSTKFFAETFKQLLSIYKLIDYLIVN